MFDLFLRPHKVGLKSRSRTGGSFDYSNNNSNRVDQAALIPISILDIKASGIVQASWRHLLVLLGLALGEQPRLALGKPKQL